ncbi:MGMT family protein [Leifsonia aquatica]|uniref:MGMT family protein n=1 Tax=Leifsonia aquatica TaxID=144185 RepID=UPI0004A7F66D
MPSSSERVPAGGEAGGADGAADSFVERVLGVVESIPPGQVMTYGDVAAVLGSRAARMVGQIMAYYGSTVPWWRVVRASGHPPADHEHLALPHYRAEGTPLLGGPRADGTTTAYRVDLRTARYESR